MLLKITERCSMHCTHCFNRADENGAHMVFGILKKVVDKLNELPYHTLLLTGGEPTEHPDFWEITKYLSQNLKNLDYIQVILTTNGLYLENHIELADALNHLFDNFAIQITNDPRYYPKPLDESSPLYLHPYVFVAHKVEHMTPQGRAVDNGLPSKRVASSCINCRSFIHQLPQHAIEDVIYALEAEEKYCTPTIGVDGMIRAGESSLCPPFASVEDSNEIISKKLKAFRCNQCATVGLNKNIPQVLKDMLGVG